MPVGYGHGGIGYNAAETAGSGSYTDEEAQDAVGSILSSTTSIALTYNDAGPAITADVIGLAVTALTGLSDETVVGQQTGGSEGAVNPSAIAQTINTFTTSTYILALTDRGKIIESSTTATAIVFVPVNAGVAFPTGTRIDFVQRGSGQLQISTSVGATVFAARSDLTLATVHAFATIYKRDTNEWVLGGDLS